MLLIVILTELIALTAEAVAAVPLFFADLRVAVFAVVAINARVTRTQRAGPEHGINMGNAAIESGHHSPLEWMPRI